MPAPQPDMPAPQPDAPARSGADGGVSPAPGRLVVWVGNNPHAQALVHHAAQLAAMRGTPWTAVCVESGDSVNDAPSQRLHALRALELAERLGASTAVVNAESAIAAVVERVRNERASTVLIGAHAPDGWLGGLRERWLGRIADALGAQIPDVVVDVVHFPKSRAAADELIEQPHGLARQWRDWLQVALVVLLGTVVSETVLSRLQLVAVATIYLAGVVYVALRMGQSAALLAVVLSILSFDLVFVQPRWSFKPTDPQYYLVFLVMLVVGVLISRLAEQARQQARVADARARRAHALNGLAHGLLSAQSEQAIAAGLSAAVRSTFGAHSALLLPDGRGALIDPCGVLLEPEPGWKGRTTEHDEWATAKRAFDAGRSVETEAGEPADSHTLCVPLNGASGCLGVLVVRSMPGRFPATENRDLLESFANLAALALERTAYERRSAAAVLDAEAERLRNTLLSGISHDFRTPMTTIVGAATSLLEQQDALGEADRERLLQGIVAQARRMHESMSDLLDLVRMEEGVVKANCEWCPADELIEEALQALGQRLQQRVVRIVARPDAIVWCDPRLVGQALANLLDNALRHTPEYSAIEIHVEVTQDAWQLIVADEGPGVPAGRRSDIFKKFARGRDEPAGTGTGLGLAICAAVARLHGGDIAASDGPGARFVMTLPQPATPAPSLNEPG